MGGPGGGPDLALTTVRQWVVVQEMDRPGGGPDLATTTMRVQVVVNGPGNGPPGMWSGSSSHHSEGPRSGEWARKWTAREAVRIGLPPQ